MKTRCTYRSPLGDEVEDPDEDFIKKIIYNYDQNYWSKETTGDSAIVVRENNRDLILVFFYDHPHGFFLYYDVKFVPLIKNTPLKDTVVIKHFIGSEPMLVPAICYRSREESWEIISEFIDNHTKCDKFKWVQLGDIDYDWNLINI